MEQFVFKPFLGLNNCKLEQCLFQRMKQDGTFCCNLEYMSQRLFETELLKPNLTIC